MSATLRRALPAGAVTAGLASLALAAAPGAAQAQAPSQCPATVDASAFTSQAELRKLVRKEMSYGLRFPGTESDRRELRWIESQVRQIPGARSKRQSYRTPFWYPTTKGKRGVSLDLVRAGGLDVTSRGREARVPVASAMPFSKPTGDRGGKSGRLVHLRPGQAITAANAKGKVVIRDFQEGSIPYAGLQALSIFTTPDVAGKTGDFTRPYLTANLNADMLAASKAGAAGVVMGFDVPREQVEGYFDPHDGTLYRVPAVFTGHAEMQRLERLAKAGRSARVTVRAKVVRKGTDDNLIATIPGRSAKKVVLGVNHDGAGWVQDNGVAGLIALGRYYAGLPADCREKTLVLAFGANHTSVRTDGFDRYSDSLDRQYGQGKVAFGMTVEHLGTREIAPVRSGGGRRLEFTGKLEPWLWAVGPSDTMRAAVVESVKRRELSSAAVLRGASAPTQTVPNICSFGGLGGALHTRLIPSAAVISGPWTLYGPGRFGEKALDYAHMRKQLLAIGDAVLALDGVPQQQIAGGYTQWRRDRANGAATCPQQRIPQDAPAS